MIGDPCPKSIKSAFLFRFGGSYVVSDPTTGSSNNFAWQFFKCIWNARLQRGSIEKVLLQKPHSPRNKNEFLNKNYSRGHESFHFYSGWSWTDLGPPTVFSDLQELIVKHMPGLLVKPFSSLWACSVISSLKISHKICKSCIPWNRATCLWIFFGPTCSRHMALNFI